MESENHQSDSLSVNVRPPLYSEIPGTVPLNTGAEGGPPPSYEDVVDPEASPPTYQSLFGQVREARKNSSNFIDFLRKVIVILLGTIGCSIILGITIVVPISMVIIGTQYFGECPVEQFIPIYLIVGGAFGIFKNLLGYIARCKKNDDEQEHIIHRSRDSIINCFLFAWFITGCIWTYRVYEPEYEDITSPFYCNKTLYLFAFWLVTASFILSGLLTIFCTCFIVSSVVTNIE
ncbi:transmembrane protein 272 isoform X4 [Parasteatoda tepidariorum]|uniref:transmembrane protein 272 isoform X3 n=1 Tax=Parasteatoda tepidariorum TaxID=114398 RepID=UPI001C720B91|nr:transmembrane protein 272 isoform X3 [Parasteatoda tepidariorum]XP_042911630.1 transmembrane protein 272 isoform X4 [Parasteatoda tepidariorum]